MSSGHTVGVGFIGAQGVAGACSGRERAACECYEQQRMFEMKLRL